MFLLSISALKAVEILEAYEGTLEDDYPPDNERCEHGEMLLYKVFFIDVFHIISALHLQYKMENACIIWSHLGPMGGLLPLQGQCTLNSPDQILVHPHFLYK